MTTRIFLIRHGATTLTEESRFAGASSDVPLSEEGRQQAQQLAARLAGMHFAGIYASPLGRAMDTARILAAPHDLPIIQVSALREIDHGHWDAKTRDDVETQFPEEYAAWEEDPFSFAPAGGETGLAVTARALPALLDIVRTHDNHSVLVVSHKATIRLIISSLLGFDPRMYRDHLDLSPASLTIVDFKNVFQARLTVYNDTAHYSALGMAIPEVPSGKLSKAWGEPGSDAQS